MKKRSTWIVFLAALLCLTMLFVSCESNADTDDETDDIETTDTDETTEPQETEEPEEAEAKNEDVDYDGMLAKWTQYLTYKPEEGRDVLSATQTLYTKANIQKYGDLAFYIVPNQTQTYTWTEYYVYNLVTGEQLFQGSTSRSNIELNETRVEYDVTVLADGAMFLVEKTESVHRPDPTDPYYQGRTPYYTALYYDAQGTILHKFERQTDYRTYHNEEYHLDYTYITVEDQCYVCTDSQIVTTFAATEMRGIPEMTHEYNGKHYSIIDSMVWVFDENYDELVSYEFESGWDYDDSYLLANGNLFVQYQWLCTDDQQKYNVEDTYGTKHLVKQVIVSVTDGSVTELTPAFIVEELISNAEENGNCVTLNGDYQLAMVYKIGEDKVAVNQPTFAVLDNNMAITAELPALLKNQCDLIVGHDADTFMIPVDVYKDAYDLEEYHYLIDKNTGKVSLYTATRRMPAYQSIEGGFIYNDILYNNDLVELKDLRYVSDYKVIEGVLFVEEEDMDDFYRVVYILNGTVISSDTTIDLSNGDPDFRGDYFSVTLTSDTDPDYRMTCLYNVYGTLLVSARNIRTQSAVSDGILVRCSNATIFAADTYYTYYIIK